MNGQNIHRLADMIGRQDVRVRVPGYGTARAVPLPFVPGFIGRLRPALAVLVGRAHAVEWPKPGDLEKALRKGLLT